MKYLPLAFGRVAAESSFLRSIPTPTLRPRALATRISSPLRHILTNAWGSLCCRMTSYGVRPARKRC